jgi:ribosomal protein S18 acetylase RimI-like enzyme
VKPCDIRPIISQTGWDAYAELKRIDCHEYALHSGSSTNTGDLADGFVTASRLKSPPVKFLLAYAEDQAVGHCNAWQGINGIGQVEDLFVRPEYRHRGIGTALVVSCVALARQNGATSVVIVVDPENSAKYIYAALGFEPLAVCRQYGRELTRAATAQPQRTDAESR